MRRSWLCRCLRKGCEVGPGMTYIDGATHERRSVYGLPKYSQHVLRGPLQLEALGHAPCEVLKALHRVAPRQCFIGPAQPVGTERALWALGERCELGHQRERGGKGRMPCHPSLCLSPGSSCPIAANGWAGLEQAQFLGSGHSLSIGFLQEGTPELSALA